MTARSLFSNPIDREEQLSNKEFNDLLGVQNDILRAAVVTTDSVTLIDRLCLQAERLSPGSVSSIMLLRKTEQRLYVYAGPSLNDESIDRLNGLRVGEGSCGNVVYHDEEMYVCNTLEDRRWEQHREFAQEFGLMACWAFPIRDENNNAIGSFALSSFERREPNAMQRALLQVCASIAAILIQRDSDQKQKAQWEHDSLQREKLESLGVLAGGIAHDFNNLLGVISGNIDLCRHSLHSAGRENEYLNMSANAVERAVDLTRQLLTFSKGGDPVKKAHNLRETVIQSARFVLHGSSVALDFQSASEEAMTAKFDRGQLSQVIQNIVLNARQAMPEGGTVTIRFLTNVRLLDTGKENDQYYHRIDIIDQGEGIRGNNMDHIFDPYFTTKEKGSGLGLAIAYSIVRKHDGHIRVTSGSDSGTTFSLYFPASTETPIETEDGFTEKTECEGVAIVMDDEEMLQEVAAAMLSQMGFDVHTASEGNRTIEIFKELMGRNVNVDLVMLDLTVPGGMGGKETVAELLQLDPEANIIVCSGYSNDSVMSNFTKFGFKAAIGKPYLSDELAAVVNKVLSKDSSS